MRISGSRRSTMLALSTAALLVLAACGGNDGDESTDEAAEAGAAEPAAAEDDSGDGGSETAEADTLTTGGVDLGGPEIDPSSEIETNLFPDLVVDDVGRGKKVNIRNIVPSDKPVLLWMWAPH